MRVAGERIILVGDSLSHHGHDNAPEIWDVTEGSNRPSAQPGDLLASMLAERGAQAVRINARVGRSAWNFWTRENATSLLASDQAFKPTQVIVMLGSNDAGLSMIPDQVAMTKLRDAYQAMGAEVWAIGPFSNTSLDPAKVELVVQMMRRVFGGAVGRFVDGRPLSLAVVPGRDGLHYDQINARALAATLANAIETKVSPSTLWQSVGFGLLGVGAAFAGFQLYKRHQRKQPLLGDTEDVADIELAATKMPSRDEIDALIQSDDPAALDIAQDALLQRGDRVSQIAKVSGEIGEHTWANYELKLGEAPHGETRLAWRVTKDGAGRCHAEFSPFANGVRITDQDPKKPRYTSMQTQRRNIFAFEEGYYGGADYCERAAASSAWAIAKALKRLPKPAKFYGELSPKATPTERLKAYIAEANSEIHEALNQDNSEPEELYGLGDVDAAKDSWSENELEQQRQYRRIVHGDDSPEALDVAEDFVEENELKLRNMTLPNYSDGNTGSIRLKKGGKENDVYNVWWEVHEDPDQDGYWTQQDIIWNNARVWNPYISADIELRPDAKRFATIEEARKHAAADAWALAKALRRLPIDTDITEVERVARVTLTHDNFEHKPHLYGLGARSKSHVLTDDEFDTRMRLDKLVRDPDPHALDVVEDGMLEKGYKLSRLWRVTPTSGEIVLSPIGEVEKPTVVRWNIEQGTKKRGKKGSNAYNWGPSIEVIYEGQRQAGNSFNPSWGDPEHPTREAAHKAGAAIAWSIAKSLKALPPGSQPQDVFDVTGPAIRAHFPGGQETARGARQGEFTLGPKKALYGPSDKEDELARLNRLANENVRDLEPDRPVNFHKLTLDPDSNPATLQVAEDYLLERGIKMREAANGLRARNFSIQLNPMWWPYEKWKNVGASVDTSNQGVWTEIHVSNGKSRVSRTYFLPEGHDLDDAKKIAVANMWALAKAIKPFSLDTDEATIARVVDSTLPKLVGPESRKRPRKGQERKNVTNEELFGLNAPVHIVDGKKHHGDEASLVHKGYRPVACKSELDKKGLAKCWSKEVTKAVIENLGKTPSMLKTIASESQDANEFARRAEAWASSEANPPSDKAIARAWFKDKPTKTLPLIQQAREARQATTQQRFKKLARGLSEPKVGDTFTMRGKKTAYTVEEIIKPARTVGTLRVGETIRVSNGQESVEITNAQGAWIDGQGRRWTAR